MWAGLGGGCRCRRFLDAVVVVADSFDHAGVGAVALLWVGFSGDLGDDVGQDVFPLLRGESRHSGGGAADDAQGAGERDPVGVDVRGLGDQVADGVVDQQPGPDLLDDQPAFRSWVDRLVSGLRL